MNFIRSILNKTLFGLPSGFYLKNFIFGLVASVLYGAFLLYAFSSHSGDSHFELFCVMISIVLLLMSVSYPFALFMLTQVRDSVVRSLCGDRDFKSFGMLIKVYVGFFVISFSYSLSVFIAPVCITYLYFYNTSNKGRVIDA